MHRLIPLLATAMLCLLTAACGSSTTNVAVTVKASPQINPNSDNQPSPTVVRFYDLKSADAFNGATFFDIYDDDVKKLGPDMLAKKEIEVLPGATVTFNNVAAPGSVYLGVLAGFRQLDGAKWRDVFTLSQGSSNTIIVTLDARSVTAAKPPSRFLGIF